jgi:hypothetical protein
MPNVPQPPQEHAVTQPSQQPVEVAAPPEAPPVPEMPDVQQPPEVHAVPQTQQQPVQPASAPRAPQRRTAPEFPQVPLPHRDEAGGPETTAVAGADELEPYHDEQQNVTEAEPEEKHPQPVPRAAARKSAAAAPLKQRLDIMQKAINAGIVKPPKPSIKKEALAATGVVSRDREALARLLTSF